MTTIYRDDRIDNLEDEVDYLNTQLGQDIVQIQADITALQTDVGVIQGEQITQDGRLDNLETDITNLTLNASLTDVQVGLGPADGDILKWNALSTSWIPSVENPFPEVVDNSNYVRNVGVWNTLASTSEITTLQTDLGTAQSDITNLQTDLGTAQGDITNLQTDLGTAQSDINNLQALFPIALNDLSDVDLSTPPTLNQILKYNGTNFIAANESGGVSTLAGLSDVNLGTLANGDVLSYDLANSEWVNSGLSLTPAALEYLQFKSLTGTCLIDPNTTGEFGISSAIGFFGLPSSGTADFDQTRSSGIISIINNK